MFESSAYAAGPEAVRAVGISLLTFTGAERRKERPKKERKLKRE